MPHDSARGAWPGSIEPGASQAFSFPLTPVPHRR